MAVAEFCGFHTVSDINADGVARYVNSLKDENRSAATINYQLTILKGFCKWLTEHHKLPRDPLASIRKPSAKTDRRRERRMLLPEEWQWLEPITRNGPERYGMAGPERALLYATAIQSGLRSKELRSLTRGRLFFDSSPPYITCKAGATKNHEFAWQYIQPELVSDLKAHITTKAPKAPVFNMPHATNVARMLRGDLAEARKAWLKKARQDPDEYARREESDFLRDANHEGEVADFHSLRHTCGAWLAMTGAYPKTVQAVMRHCTITLMMDTYGHLFPGQEADAVARMRDMVIGPPIARQATGTNDEIVEHSEGAQRRA
jgi:integrase